MSDDTLRDEILGDDGFAKWLRGERLSGKALAERAQERIQGELGAVSCANVNDYLCRLLDVEYEIYLELERELIEGAIEAFLNASEGRQRKYPTLQSLLAELQQQLAAGTPPNQMLVAISKPLAHFYKLLTESFAQSRKTRAGGSAQYHVAFILNQLGYQGLYERQRTLNGTVDFLFPSLAMWEKDRRRCTVLSVKRTLRERYKQVFEELTATRGLTMYLMSTQTEAEAQKDITAEKVQVISQQNVYLVVRDAIKQARFASEASVLGFTDFFCKELPRLRAGWED
jgi:EcoRII C terminal.